MSFEAQKPDMPIQEKLTPLPPQAVIQLRQQLNRRSRRTTALWLGFVMGAGYFSVTQLINPLYLPGVPTYQVSPGMPWTALIAGLACMLIGAITGWPESSALGILFGSLLGTLVFDAYAVVNTLPDRVSPALIIAFLVLVLLPMTAMTATFIGVFRWALDRQQSAWQDQGSALITVGIPLLLILAAAGAGASALYPDSGRQILPRMNQLILTGQAANNPAELPQALAADSVNKFKANAVGAYTLEWSQDPTNRFAIPRPANNGNDSISIARFTNGYMLICLYPDSSADPECVSRSSAP